MRVELAVHGVAGLSRCEVACCGMKHAAGMNILDFLTTTDPSPRATTGED